MKQQTFATSQPVFKGKETIDFSGKTIYVGIDAAIQVYKKQIAHFIPCHV